MVITLSPQAKGMLTSLPLPRHQGDLEVELLNIRDAQSFVTAFQGLLLEKVFDVPVGVRILLEDIELLYYGSRIGSDVESVAEFPPGHLTVLMDSEGNFFAAGLGVLHFLAHNAIQLMNRVAREYLEKQEKIMLAERLIAQKESQRHPTLLKIGQENAITLDHFLLMAGSAEPETRRLGFYEIGQMTFWNIAIVEVLFAGLQDSDESVIWSACAALLNRCQPSYFDRTVSFSKCLPLLVERFLSDDRVSRIAGLTLSAFRSHCRPFLQTILSRRIVLSDRHIGQIVAILGQFESLMAAEQEILLGFCKNQSPRIAEAARLVCKGYQKTL